MFVKLVVIAAYGAMIIVVGLFGFKKTKSFSDFFLGGGNVGAWMTAFSYGTAYFSAVLFIGFAGKIGWGFGLSGIWIAVFNSLIGVCGVWAIMGWKIKQASIKYNISTLSEYFEKRYDSKFLKVLSALAIFVFLIPYTAAVFMGLSYLFTENFGIQYRTAIVLIGIFTAIYLVLGGYKSMAMIDMIFGMIMTAGVIVLLVFTIQKGGGLQAIAVKLSGINPGLAAPVGPPGLWKLVSLIVLTSAAPFAMPQLIQKFYAIKDRKAIKTGIIASTAFAVLIVSVAYFVGSTTRIFLSPETTPEAFNAAGAPIFDRLMPVLLTKIIPEYLAVLILLLILSASMSTLAALVLISSSSLAKDFYAGFVNKNITDKNLTLLMRFMSAFFVVLAVLMALVKFDTIVAVLGISWGAIGSVFLGPFIWGLFLKKANKFGAIGGGVLGLLTCLILYFLPFGTYKFSSPEAGTLGMAVSFIITPTLSLAVSKTARNTQ